MPFVCRVRGLYEERILNRLHVSWRVETRASAFLHHELGASQLGKTAAFRHPFLESSSFDHTPAVKHQNKRGVANGREAVGDDEGGASLHHLVKRGVNLGLGDRIERAGCLVENQDRWILQERACNRQPLPLPTRQ